MVAATAAGLGFGMPEHSVFTTKSISPETDHNDDAAWLDQIFALSWRRTADGTYTRLECVLSMHYKHDDSSAPSSSALQHHNNPSVSAVCGNSCRPIASLWCVCSLSAGIATYSACERALTLLFMFRALAVMTGSLQG